jgi:hypothetical protein
MMDRQHVLAIQSELTIKTWCETSFEGNTQSDAAAREQRETDQGRNH